MSGTNNIPAFPIPHYTRPDGDVVWGGEGMQLRDYFAGQAMMGFVTGNTTDGRPIVDASNYLFIARQSYEMADAMLIIRQEIPNAESG